MIDLLNILADPEVNHAFEDRLFDFAWRALIVSVGVFCALRAYFGKPPKA